MLLDFSSFNWSSVAQSVLNGLAFSIMLTVAATAGGVVLGIFLALARLSGIRVLKVPATAYVNTMRSIPLVMVILWFFLLVPAGLYEAIAGEFGRNHRSEISAILTFVAFEAAYFCEIVRAGILSIPRGQSSAAHAIGMSYAQNLRFIVLPQALRNMSVVLSNDQTIG
ncbi:amino acid ABC transporter permease [Pandoraea anhela]|uniref:Amino acid ABC transporter permease n=1 Tax=Pandoraea anhela TaxID=2508295 RepID=A0A5E4R766_9BURK|nr:amino acid ABC transporter permease [Pandoraea anhela]